jgi:hypothetical protein
MSEGEERGLSAIQAAAVRRSAKGKQVAARIAAWIVATRLEIRYPFP